jgi:site-specific DNA-methyltransferase (adenine-specific)
MKNTINLIHGNCMDYMKTLSDKAYDLAIVDPPYGLAESSLNGSGKLKSRKLNTSNTN